jgi:hypothetical protein
MSSKVIILISVIVEFWAEQYFSLQEEILNSPAIFAGVVYSDLNNIL